MAKNKPEVEKVRVQGFVTRIVFANVKDFFYIFTLLTEDKQSISVKGSAQVLRVGNKVEIEGVYEDTKHGRQIVASYLENLSCAGTGENSREGIIAFLSSGMVKGVGKVMAARIVESFGEKALDVIESTPELLVEIKGITAKKSKAIQSQVVEQRAIARLMSKLGKYGFTARMMIKINALFGSKSIIAIEQNPYCLCKVSGVGFKMADQYALSAGTPKESEHRIKEGIKFTLREAVMQGGSCGILGSLLISKSVELLEVDQELVTVTAQQVAGDGDIILENGIYYDKMAWNAEISIASHLHRMMQHPVLLASKPLDDIIAQAESNKGITLSSTQRQAVLMAISNPVSVITGQPGTGKTTIVQVLIESLRLIGDGESSIAASAPTGKAANRLMESCGYGETQHRMLKAKGASVFEHNENSPVDFKTIIVDEFSMNDVFLANATFRALSDGARLVVVGDINQLPSVGPGQVLRDMIESGRIPVTKLTEIRRQGEGSGIVMAASAINAGKTPVTNTERNDFIIINSDTPGEKMLAVAKRMLATGESPDDIQVLCPMKNGNAGVKAMNKALQPILNPNAIVTYEGDKESANFIERFDTQYFVGDRVMQLSNNYDFGVFNGDVGKVIEIDIESDIVTVRFNSTTVDYCGTMLDSLTLSYACTVHKFQGSEAKNVIMPITTSHYMMLKRNLIYTGITRARNRMVLVVEPYKGRPMAALQMAVKKVETEGRISRLAKLLANIGN